MPGSAHQIDAEELDVYLASDIMRVLRTVPGVFLQEEDGYGLRPNIGIRGSGLDRSARIALLEDGVLIAPAPYAHRRPIIFHTATHARVEVLKGPSSIAVGPRTTGGAINLISTPDPGRDGWPDRSALWRERHCRCPYSFRRPRTAILMAGRNRAEPERWFQDHRRAGRRERPDTGFDIEDYVVKMQLDSKPSASLYQSLRFKGGYTDQVSDETYLGLTDDDFRANPYRRYAASAEDVFNGEHEQLQLSYVVESES